MFRRIKRRAHARYPWYAPGFLLWGFVSLCIACAPVHGETVRVAAAADLIYALEDIAGVFQEETGHQVKLSFGSSGNYTHQILRGAPFHVFFSANALYVDKLMSEAKTEGAGIPYATGLLALYVRDPKNLTPTSDLRHLGAAVRGGKLGKIAIANPAHAPYGQAAREILTSAGLWEAVQKQLVLGENAAQTAQFAASKSVDVAFIPYAFTASPVFSKLGAHTVAVSDTLYSPLQQHMVLLKGANPAARSLVAFVQSAQAKAILQRHGFGAAPGP